MKKWSFKTRVRDLGLAVSAAALGLGAGFVEQANAQTSYPEGSWNEPQIVPNNNLNPFQPPPAGVLDDGVIGIGQMITDVPPPGGSVGLCTGTLINPRTVVFAAHCVNTAPANAYGSAQGGIALSFGFNPNNLPAAQNWISNNWQTNTALNIYNANQVWYDPRSLELGPGLNFLQADVALATLDTPAFGIPTWTLLFSPLTEETHAMIVGYGATGTGSTGANLGIDFRRRAAENMLSSLSSLNDVDDFLFGENSGLPQSLYQLDFDDPANPPYDGVVNFDFDLFDGEALPGESTTAGGDSGGPLIVDQMFDVPVVVGVLSGGTRFHGPQPFSSYGTSSFYQPLFLFWDVIVQNNSYVYAESKAGIANWMNPNHWVQAMDPNYAVIRDGELVNDLPDTPAQGVTGDTTKFGNICFDDGAGFEVCQDISQSGPGENSTGPGLILPGGPGSTNFVPNNVEPDRLLGIQARYYDVTLAAIGQTYLKDAVTIDRFTIDGLLTALDVRSAGTLNVLGDFNLVHGAVNVDGHINSGEALVVQGLLTGRGTFNPTFLTSVDGIIAPGGLIGVGTLTVQGDVILASGNELLIEVGRRGADQLHVTADPAQGTTGIIDLGGDLWLTLALGGGLPRHGQSFTIVLADDAVLNTFDDVNSLIGILKPTVTYLPDSVRIDLKAGKFADLFFSSPQAMAFANALDNLRDGSYNNLYGLYGELDVMNLASIERAFGNLGPSSLFDAQGLLALQDSTFSGTIQDRLSLLSKSGNVPNALSIIGAPGQVLAFGGDDGLSASSTLNFASILQTSTNVAELPEGMSAFFSGGYVEGMASAVTGRTALMSGEGLQTWHMAGGVERHLGDFTLGVAASYARGSALQSQVAGRAENDLAQSVAYGVYRFDSGAYVSGLVGAGMSRTETDRRFAVGSFSDRMQGATRGDVYQASLEGGINFDLTDALTLTPKVSMRQFTLRMDGYAEGGGEAALAFEEQVYDRFEARVGASLAGDYALASGWRIAPVIEASLVRNLAGDEAGVWARFAAAPDVPFYLPGALRDDVWGEVRGDLRIENGLTSFGLRVETNVDRDEVYEDRYLARFAYKF